MAVSSSALDTAPATSIGWPAEAEAEIGSWRLGDSEDVQQTLWALPRPAIRRLRDREALLIDSSSGPLRCHTGGGNNGVGMGGMNCVL